MPLGMLGASLIGTGLGAAAGAMSPTPPKRDYKDLGVGFLTGYHDERQSKYGDPLLGQLLGQALGGKGNYLSTQEIQTLLSPQLSAIDRNVGVAKQNMQERGLAQGHGPGSGMGAAGALQADLAGLDARRKAVGQVQGANVQQAKKLQSQAQGRLLNQLSLDSGAENAQIGQDWQAMRDRRMAGSRLYRGLLGGAAGFGASLPFAAGAGMGGAPGLPSGGGLMGPGPGLPANPNGLSPLVG